MDTPLPEASGFEHLTIETPGLASHVAVIGDGNPVVMLHGFPHTGGSGARSRRCSPNGIGLSAPTFVVQIGPSPRARASSARPA